MGTVGAVETVGLGREAFLLIERQTGIRHIQQRVFF